MLTIFFNKDYVSIFSSSPQEAHTSSSLALSQELCSLSHHLYSKLFNAITNSKSFVHFHRYKKFATQAHTKEKWTTNED